MFSEPIHVLFWPLSPEIAHFWPIFVIGLNGKNHISVEHWPLHERGAGLVQPSSYSNEVRLNAWLEQNGMKQWYNDD